MNAKPKRQFLRPPYQEQMNKALEFLQGYTEDGKHKYMDILQQIVDREVFRIDLLVEDLENFFTEEEDFVDTIVKNVLSYTRLFTLAADQKIKGLQPTIDFIDDDYDYQLLYQRQRNFELDQQPGNPQRQLPPELIRRYQLFIVRGSQTKDQMLSIRNLKANQIGSLVTLRAIVVRTSEVRPQIIVACYSCDACGYENYCTINGKTFTPLQDCASDRCKENKVRGRLLFNHGNSLFIPHQELKIQELREQLPKGVIPRTFTVYCRGETNVRQCAPGDIIKIQGVFLPDQKEGYFANKSSLYVSFVEAFSIFREKKKYSEIRFDSAAGLKIFEDTKQYSFDAQFTKLARSIAPEIFGLDDVKKALVLMMVGGVYKEMEDGLKIRGDINIALIGDPGIAKSQLLRYVSSITPRGIYTSGKGSSSVGLTAAVIRDEVTGEMTLEGGALVMADKGICCIDEFDKMNESDRTAIHEVMEQQTVSIAKAGITTTLNARTSILAAANPLYGRYNKAKSPHVNINLPAALLSRFDLIFIMLDEADLDHDLQIAQHIGNVHQNKDNAKRKYEVYSEEEIKTYIAMTQQYHPLIKSDVHQFITEQYVQRRQVSYDKTKEGYSYTTPRTLLGIIRLSQAIAKLRFSREVEIDDIKEAIRLMDVSQETVRNAYLEKSDKKPKDKEDHAQIFEIIQNLFKKQNTHTLELNYLERQVKAKGFDKKTFDKFLDIYKKINQIIVHGDEVLKVSLVD
ncbi:hypothetical protein pb186bvf_015054 [Paramecium bursaria]